MQQACGARVVVGVDGSRPSLEALAWAVDEAGARSWPLEVVHVVGGDHHAIGSADDPVVEHALARARDLDRAVVARGTTVAGAAGRALARAAGPSFTSSRSLPTPSPRGRTSTRTWS